MRTRKHLRLSSILLLAGGIIFSCSKMDDNYKQFMEGGEIIYTGRVDSVKTYPGNNRIGLSMLLMSDPKISKIRLYWNNKADSAIQQVVRTAGVDTVNFMLTNMTEGTYAFEIYTSDNEGHSSIKREVIGTVYGQNYITSLFNRSLRSVTYIAPSKARLVWYGPSAQTAGQQIIYTDSLGVAQDISVPRLQDTTWLYNIRKSDYFKYRTLYKPHVNAIDTFYSQYQDIQVP